MAVGGGGEGTVGVALGAEGGEDAVEGVEGGVFAYGGCVLEVGEGFS
jgi:hypothetical protein